MARAVTITEFHQWLKKPEIFNRTWARPRYEEDFADDMKDVEAWPFESTHMIAKYFYLSLDTRDMKIYSITYNSWGNDITIRDDSNDDNKTILDLVEEKLIKGE